MNTSNTAQKNNATQQTNANVQPIKTVKTVKPSKDAIKAKMLNGVAVELVDANVCFPEAFDEGVSNVWRRIERSEFCLDSNPFYLPDPELLKLALAIVFTKEDMAPLGLHGETGTGKTEMIMYIADRLNQPLMVQKFNQYMTADQLEGDRELSNDNGVMITTESLSPLAQAAEEGMWVICDEIDKMNNDVSASLHLLLENKPWNLNVFKRRIVPHGNFKMFATANTMGEGDHPRYTSSNQMDAAIRGRIGWLMVDFPKESHELNILMKKFPKFSSKLCGEMVKTANHFRDALLGPKRDGNTDNPINCVFSTRTLSNWGTSMNVFGDNRIMMDALKYAFWGSVDADSREVASDIIHNVWAGNEKITIGELKDIYSPKK